MRPLNADDYRRAARRILPRGLFEYIERGTEDEVALARLRSSLDAITLRPSVLTGHARRELATTVLGRRIAAPIAVAPTALAGLVAHRGEVKLARAAAAVGIPYCVPTQSVTTVEAIREGAPEAELWFQLYVWRDRALTWQLLDRARDCGCACLVVTSDTPIPANREYNRRNGFAMPFVPTPRAILDVALHPRWLAGVLVRHLLSDGAPTHAHHPAEHRRTIARSGDAAAVRLDDRLCWDDLRKIRDAWPGRLIVKGVLSVEDAEIAAAAGADGVVVSAHGARNLDCLPAPADCLAAIADAVGGRLAVLADSGVRRGTDVLKYLSLGAEAVLLGRLPLWGLAAGGEAGAEDALRMIVREMDMAMTFLGIDRTDSLRSRRL